MLKKQIPLIIETKQYTADFIEQCHRHQISGLLYYHYEEFRTNDNFKKSWINQWARNEKLISELEALRAVVPHPINLVVIKGISHLGTIYQDLGSRFMSDVDLLVDKKDLVAVEAALAQLGFIKLFTSKWKANSHKSEWSIFRDEMEITIELHTNLFYHNSFKLSDTTFENSHIQGYKKLSFDLELLYLSYHYAYQHNFLRLYWAFDIYLLFEKKQDTINWNKLLQLSQELKVKKSFLLTVSTIDRFFPLTYKPLKDYATRGSEMIDADFLWSDDMKSKKYMLIKHLTKDSFLTAFEYDFLWLWSKIKEKFLR